MSKERLGGEKRSNVPRWLARATGATCVSALLFVPASAQPLDNEQTLFNPGTTRVIPDFIPNPDINYPPLPPEYDAKTGLTRDTGMDSLACAKFEVCGTDLGIPFRLPDGSTAYLFGDTFAVTGPFMEDLPPGSDRYRAQAMLRATETPVEGKPIQFDAAVGEQGTNRAIEFLGGWHMLVNDGVSLPDGRVIVSYQHTVDKGDSEDKFWHTDYSGLAVSTDGLNYERIGPVWENNADISDPYQMWSMQRDGDYVYVVSVRAGRQPGPMMLFRAPWTEMLDKNAYTYWDGEDWGAKQDAEPIMEGFFGEPSLRKLDDGTWVLAYADYSRGPKIVTRTLEDPATGPEGEWNDPKTQLTWAELPFLYGGFIHPDSTPDNLIMMVSSWQRKEDGSEHGQLVRYDVSHMIRSLQ